MLEDNSDAVAANGSVVAGRGVVDERTEYRRQLDPTSIGRGLEGLEPDGWRSKGNDPDVIAGRGLKRLNPDGGWKRRQLEGMMLLRSIRTSIERVGSGHQLEGLEGTLDWKGLC